MKLRKRFLTQEEKAAYRCLQEKKKQEDKIRAIREARIEKVRAKKNRELQKKRDERTLKSNLQGCQPGFLRLVKPWAKGKSTAVVNNLFDLLEEFHCKPEPCYNTNKLGTTERVLRTNKSGYKKLNQGLHLPDIVLGSDFWNNDYEREYQRAHKLDSILYSLA